MCGQRPRSPTGQQIGYCGNQPVLLVISDSLSPADSPLCPNIMVQRPVKITLVFGMDLD